MEREDTELRNDEGLGFVVDITRRHARISVYGGLQLTPVPWLRCGSSKLRSASHFHLWVAG